MGDREIVGREIRRLCILIDERRVRIADNLAVPVVFHHDDEHMIDMRNTGGGGTFDREGRGAQDRREQARSDSKRLHGLSILGLLGKIRQPSARISSITYKF